MEIIDIQKSFLENLSFISGPIMALLGLGIFWQIKLTKRTIEVTENQISETKNQLKIISTREAAAFAAKQTEVFIENIIRLSNEVHKKKEEINYPEFNGKIEEFSKDELSKWDKTYSEQFNEKVLLVEYLDLKLINSLESFAIYFTKGIADEEIAFSSIGISYCEYVEQNYPLISILRDKDKPKNPYENLIELYRLWKSRLEKYNIEVELAKKQKEMNQEIINLEKIRKDSLKIPPIGTT